MKPQTAKNKDSKKLFIPEAYVIDQLRKRPEKHSSQLQTVWDLEGHLNLERPERPKRDEAQEGLIIIEI